MRKSAYLIEGASAAAAAAVHAGGGGLGGPSKGMPRVRLNAADHGRQQAASQGNMSLLRGTNPFRMRHPQVGGHAYVRACIHLGGQVLAPAVCDQAAKQVA